MIVCIFVDIISLVARRRGIRILYHDPLKRRVATDTEDVFVPDVR